MGSTVVPSTAHPETDSRVYSLDADVPVASAIDLIAPADVSVSVTFWVNDWPTGVEAKVLFAMVGDVTMACAMDGSSDAIASARPTRAPVLPRKNRLKAQPIEPITEASWYSAACPAAGRAL